MRILIALVVLAGCSEAAEPRVSADGEPLAVGEPGMMPLPTGEPGIRGIVTAAESGVITVEENPAEESGSDKVIARLRPETLVAYRGGERVTAQELTVGHNVSVWFSGPVAESYPRQATAAAVIIEPAGIP